jgi:hypothetical protein
MEVTSIAASTMDTFVLSAQPERPGVEPPAQDVSRAAAPVERIGCNGLFGRG